MDVSPAKRSYFTCANVWWKFTFSFNLFFCKPFKINGLQYLYFF